MFVTLQINGRTLYLTYHLTTPGSHFHPDAPSYKVSMERPDPLSTVQASDLLTAHRDFIRSIGQRPSAWKVTQA